MSATNPAKSIQSLRSIRSIQSIQSIEPTHAVDPTPVAVDAGHWRALCGETTAAFTVRDKLVATVRGTIPVLAGKVVMDEGGHVAAARLEMEVAAIHTGNAHRDRDLRKSRFLDADTHPRLVVEVGHAMADATGWDLEGVLSARGARTPVTLRAVPVSLADGRVQVRITGRLDRTGLGMKVPTFIVGRHVDLIVEATFRHDAWTGPSGHGG
jgi:polyisoprenoid-binding protein YceI